MKGEIVKVLFKTKVRVYTALFLLLSTITIVSYLNSIKVKDQISIDCYYADNAELILERLSWTEWGQSSRGKKIISSFKRDELRIVYPHQMKIGDRLFPYYDHHTLDGPATGAFVIEKGSYRIYIGLYHASELDTTRVFRYMDYAIPEDEFIHILIDELVHRYYAGRYFVDGVASNQEEVDAWEAAEEAVKAYYGSTYKVGGSSKPQYGPDSDWYRKIK